MTEDLLVRDATSSSSPKWTISPHVEDPGIGLKFACRVFTWAEKFLRIRTKDGTVVPFRMNTIQQILAQYVAWCWHNAIPVKVALPKGRQMGSSTFWQVLFFTMCELKPGYRVATVAHDEEGATEIFGKSQTFKRELDKTPWGRPDLLQDQSGFMLWAHESSLSCGTIKTGDALGKGGTPSAIHFSESANFSDKGVNARRAVNSIVNARADNRWTIECHESTAKGKDPFYWPLCERARDPNSGSDYRLIFLPWFLEKGYSLTWEEYRRIMTMNGRRDPGKEFIPTTEELKLRRRLQDTVVQPHERHHRYQTYLTDEQLIWRRWAITNKCDGDEDEFKRYYPSFYEEAFTASSSSMFDDQTVDYYRSNSRAPVARGKVTETPGTNPPATFERMGHGSVQVWEFPRPGEEYVIGADIGGEKADSDPSCAYVIKKHSLQVVAMIHGQFEWDHYADDLFNLGVFYNDALLVVENNHNPATAKRLHRRRYPNLYYYAPDHKPGVGKDPGFNTNRKTRPEILKVLKRAARERFFDCPDRGLYIEMETFVWVPKASTDNPDRDGEYRAVGTNHDDRIMALALALFQCPMPEEAALHFKEEEPEPTRAYLMHLRLMQEHEEEEREAAGQFLNLGPPRPSSRPVAIPGVWNAS